MGEPITLPRPKRGFWFMFPEIKAIVSSGKVVANETKVAPITKLETPIRLAKLILLFPTQSAPRMAAIRATTKMIISGISSIITRQPLQLHCFELKN